MELIKKLRSKFSNSGLITLQIIVLVGGIVGANFAAMHAQFDWDMTEEKMHSLDDQTVGMLKKVQKPIHVMLFGKSLSENGLNLMDNFAQATPKLTYELIDPKANPELAEEYKVVEEQGVVIVETGDRRRRLPRLREQSLLNAIIQLTRDSDKQILFATGKGEKDPFNPNADGLTEAHSLLKQAGYTTHNEAITDAMLAEVKVVILAGPTSEYDDATAEKLATFVKNGGGLLVMADPRPGAALANVMAPFNIMPIDDYVIELHEGFRRPGYSASTIYERHFRADQPVGQRMGNAILMRGVRSLEYIEWPEQEAELNDPWALCISSAKSWGETDFGSKAVQFTPGSDHVGPRILAMATGDETEVAGDGRIMVVGTSAIATNRDIGIAGNREFFELTVAWLADDLDLPMITEKRIDRTLDLTDGQMRAILVTCVLAIPGLTALMGLVVFIRRTK